MDLEEKGAVEPVVEDTCEVCGAKLTEGEMKASLESRGRYLCSVHAAEEEPSEEEAGGEPPPIEP